MSQLPKRQLSLLYLIMGTLGVIGFYGFFQRWGAPFNWLMPLALAVYLMTLTFTICIHPLVCLVYVVKHARSGNPAVGLLLHLGWSLALAGAMYYMYFFKDYAITA